MSKTAKDKLVMRVNTLSDDDEYTPAAIADALGINRSTCKGYLDNLASIFPPLSQKANGHRVYGAETIKRLLIFKALKDRPARLTNAEATSVFNNVSVDALWVEYETSNDRLHKLAMECLTSAGPSRMATPRYPQAQT